MSRRAITASAALDRLISGRDLARSEAEFIFGEIMDGAVGELATAGLLAALATKGESVDEIAGAAAAMRRRLVPIPSRASDVVDTCGTGGDGKGTFNISTAAAIVAAACGVAVAKHGRPVVVVIGLTFLPAPLSCLANTGKDGSGRPEAPSSAARAARSGHSGGC